MATLECYPAFHRHHGRKLFEVFDYIITAIMERFQQNEEETVFLEIYCDQFIAELVAYYGSDNNNLTSH